ADLGEDFIVRSPSVDREPERALGDEGVAPLELERCAGWIGSRLIVSGHHPHLATVLHADLRGAEDVACGMKRDTHAAHVDRLAPADGANRGVLDDPCAQHPRTLARAQVPLAPGARVV